MYLLNQDRIPSSQIRQCRNEIDLSSHPNIEVTAPREPACRTGEASAEGGYRLKFRIPISESTILITMSVHSKQTKPNNPPCESQGTTRQL